MPQVAPMNYSPSLVEWGITAGLCAATIFMFGYVARLMPVLPKTEAVSGD
jgi:formate dehydrogenase iron-sulfur subunit